MQFLVPHPVLVDDTVVSTSQKIILYTLYVHVCINMLQVHACINAFQVMIEMHYLHV